MFRDAHWNTSPDGGSLTAAQSCHYLGLPFSGSYAVSLNYNKLCPGTASTEDQSRSINSLVT
jgi:hypothetical protein